MDRYYRSCRPPIVSIYWYKIFSFLSIILIIDPKILVKPMAINLSIHIQSIHQSKLRRNYNYIYIYIYFMYTHMYTYTYTYRIRIHLRGVNTWFPESVNIWRYALWRDWVIKSFFIELSVCEHFCFSSLYSSLTWFAVADPPFIFLFLPHPFSVMAIPWNRLPEPEKA